MLIIRNWERSGKKYTSENTKRDIIFVLITYFEEVVLLLGKTVESAPKVKHARLQNL